MNANNWLKVKTIFYEAIDLEGEARETYINTHCNDPELKGQVKALLSAHDKAEQFLEVSSFPPQSIANQNFFIGKFFGKYKINRLIAQGGMGLVFLGVRDDEVKKEAAVKIINPGASSGIIVKRFQNERQTLANLNHPNISRLLDGGITEDGIQFLVMEYIDGIPIDEYCDINNLNVKKRLRLFIKVLSTVQYAHQNLIVHRDLKPGNILVTSDGEPKLLDFGIAKILTPEGLEENTVTSKGVWNLTPEYASPEQVKGEAITTASDVYSLGIILYRLLTGHNPYNIKSNIHSDISRVISQTEAAKASEVIYQTIEKKSGEEKIWITPASVSSTRGGSIEKLHKTLQGDLDNIIAMSIRKEPARRYSSAEQLSEDIRRYLDDQPVTAHKDSLSYRTGKFVKRNKTGVISAALFLTLIILGAGGIFWQSRLTAKERDNATMEAERANKIKSFLSDMISAPDPKQDGGEVKVIDVITKASGSLSKELANQPELEIEIRTLLGTTYQNLGIYDSAEAEMNKALTITKRLYGAKSKETSIAIKNLGLVLHYEGDYEKTEELYKQSLEMLKSVEKKESFDLAKILDLYGTLMTDAGDYKKAEEITYRALKVAERTRNPYDKDVGIIKNNLATAYNYLGELDKADSLYKECLVIFRKNYGDFHIMNSSIINNMAFISIFKKDHKGAIPLLEESLNIKRTILGDDHPDLVLAYSNLGSTYFNAEQYDKAEKIIKASVDVALKNFDENNVNISRSYMWYGRALEANGKTDEGLAYLKKAYDIRRNEFGDDNKLTLVAEAHYGKGLFNARKYTEAENHLVSCYKNLSALSGKDDETAKSVAETLVDLYKARGNKTRSEYYAQFIQ